MTSAIVVSKIVGIYFGEGGIIHCMSLTEEQHEKECETGRKMNRLPASD